MRRALISAWMLACLGGCGGASRPPPHELAAMRAMLARPKGDKGPLYTEARALGERAEAAYRDGDMLLAQALGSEATARILQAEALARKDEAEHRNDEKRKDLLKDAEEARLIEERIRDAESEGAAIDRRISSLRDVIAEAKEGAASPERLAARKAAVLSVLGEARVLCGAAALLGGEGNAAELDAALSLAGKPLPKNAKDASRVSLELTHRAASLRMECLRRLTEARRKQRAAEVPVNLVPLFERGWTRRRDERGTVLVPPDTFRPETNRKELEGFPKNARMQVVRRTQTPKVESSDESVIRAALGLPAERLRFERVVSTSERDTFEFVIVE